MKGKIFMADKSKLHLINNKSSPKLKPPQSLGKAGQSLWDRITNAYAIDDEGGREMLAQCCAAADRAESLRDQINEDGEVISTRTGKKDNPLLKHEIAARSFIVRTLSRLGLSVEPVRGPGRPSQGGLGIDDTWRE
jgi:hypothetical protein